MTWKYHKKNPLSVPGPDFVAMNKGAAMDGLTGANQQRQYRKENPKRLELGAKEIPKPVLPSDQNQEHTYGRRSLNRPYEELRLTGPKPEMVDLVQGQYSMDWVKMNNTRKDHFEQSHAVIAPLPTRASLGHAMNSAKKEEEKKDLFKLKKWNKAGVKVDTRR